jgi:protein-S-isoprenylcysteine O-methyltransferase Ste14
MPSDERDDPGIKVPPPLIYLLPLILGLALDTRAHIPFLPRGTARALGWPLVGGGVMLNGWFLRTIRDAEVPIRTDRPVPRLTTEGPFRYSRNPSYLALAIIYAGDTVVRNSLWAALLLPLVVYVDPAGSDRARGAVPRTRLRGRVPGLQGQSGPLGLERGALRDSREPLRPKFAEQLF